MQKEKALQNDRAPGSISSLDTFIPDLIIPAPGVDLYHWAVIACDQYTAQPAYWQETARIVNDHPSTFHLILPEYHLEHPDGIPLEERIQKINETMRRYLDQGILMPLEPGCILVDRKTPDHERRLGLLLTIDLECYDYTPGNQQLIRATEETIVSRIPPRLSIRRDAPLELPHVQLLIDDPKNQVLSPLFQSVIDSSAPTLYDTPLMQNGGSVRGWFFPKSSDLLIHALNALLQLESVSRYGLLMATGDGNHSLAAAKAHWNLLRDHVPPFHPARYALVEVINLHDEGLSFEPIHRIISGLSPDAFLREARHRFGPSALTENHLFSSGPSEQPLVFILSGESCFQLKLDPSSLPVLLIQSFLDNLQARTNCRIDYIHGQSEVMRLVKEGQIGILLPKMQKQDLFPFVAREGILPRKSFSLGEAYEKRYYLECRRIR